MDERFPPEGYRMPRVQANLDPRSYSEYLPNQIEQCLRLTLERLQLGLKKSNTEPLSSSEIEQLATAAHNLYSIYIDQL